MVIEWKKAFSRPEIYFIILMGALVAVIGLLEAASSTLVSHRADSYYSAYQAALALGGDTAEYFAIFLLPLFAVLPYGDGYFVERRSGVHLLGLTRRGRLRYFAGQAFTAWGLAVIAVAIPYVISQLLCLIAFPTQRILDMNASANVYDLEAFFEAAGNPGMVLFLNHPLLRNIRHTLYACFYGGGIALMAYGLTLYIHKNRALALLLPAAIVYAMVLFGNMLFGPAGSLPLGIVYGANYPIASFGPMVAAIGVIYGGSIAAIAAKCLWDKDVL